VDGVSKKRRCLCDACFYCGNPLSSRHEHDHFPLPKRFGGEDIVPSCLNCHDLKDRISLAQWPTEALARAMIGMTPMGMMLVIKVLAGHFEEKAREKRKAEAT
jgi:hypothetical protein